MNPVAVYLSLEVTRRSLRSALPTAEVVPPSRWELLWASLRAPGRPPETRSAAIVPPYEVGVDTPPDPPDGRSG